MAVSQFSAIFALTRRFCDGHWALLSGGPVFSKSVFLPFFYYALAKRRTRCRSFMGICSSAE